MRSSSPIFLLATSREPPLLLDAWTNKGKKAAIPGSPGIEPSASSLLVTEPYKKHRVLYRVVAKQTDAVLEHIARADARDVKGNDQPPHYTRKRVTLYPTYSSTLFSCPFRHDTTLQHYRF